MVRHLLLYCTNGVEELQVGLGRWGAKNKRRGGGGNDSCTSLRHDFHLFDLLFHRNLSKEIRLVDHPDIVERAIPEMLEIANSPDNDAKRKVAAILCRMSFPMTNRKLLLNCPRLVRTVVKMCLHGSRTDGK